MFKQLGKLLFKTPKLVRLCSNVYLSSEDLEIFSVLPSTDNNRRHALCVTYSNAETKYRSDFYIEDTADKIEFINLLDKQIALQQSGPMSDPNIVKWIS